MGKVIAVVNQKGGVGKTTSTIEIANNLAVFERSVLVIDLDSQNSLSKYVGADMSKPTIYEVFNAEVSPLDSIQHLGRIDVIPSSENLSMADKEFIGIDDVYLLSDLIEVVQDKYEYILVDTGPSRNILINMAYVASDYIIIPAVGDDGALDGIGRVYNDVRQLRDSKRHISHAKILALIFNDFHAGRNNDEQKLANLDFLREQMEDEPSVFTVRTYTGAKECKSLKMSIMDYNKNSSAAIDFKNLTYELLDEMEVEA